METSKWPLRSVVIVCTLLISVIFLQTTEPLKAFAADSLPSGVVIGDDSGLYATSEGEYFIDIPEITIGGSYEKEITIRSLDVDEPFELGLLVNKVSSKGSFDFNEHITMTLTLDGEELYQGPVLGDGTTDWSLEPLILCVCEYGTDHLLEVRFDVPSGLSRENFKEANELLFNWSFVATKNQPPPADEPPSSSEPAPKELPKTAAPKSPVATLIERLLPKTGEDVENALLKMVAGIWLVIIAIVLWKRRKDREEES